MPWLGVLAVSCFVPFVGIGDFCLAEVTARAVGISPLLPELLVCHSFHAGSVISCIFYIFFLMVRIYYFLLFVCSIFQILQLRLKWFFPLTNSGQPPNTPPHFVFVSFPNLQTGHGLTGSMFTNIILF